MKFTITKKYEINCADDGVHCGGPYCEMWEDDRHGRKWCYLAGRDHPLEMDDRGNLRCQACLDAQAEAEQPTEMQQLRDALAEAKDHALSATHDANMQNAEMLRVYEQNKQLRDDVEILIGHLNEIASMSCGGEECDDCEHAHLCELHGWYVLKKERGWE